MRKEEISPLLLVLSLALLRCYSHAFLLGSGVSRNAASSLSFHKSSFAHPSKQAHASPKNVAHRIYTISQTTTTLYGKEDDELSQKESEAALLTAKAQELREQIRAMEEQLGARRSRLPPPSPNEPILPAGMATLDDKRILIVGANGRVGSMACRYLLRNFPQIKELVAAVHYVGEFTSRGYGRLSYEVGAEDGVGTIGPVWSEERNASFRFSDEMKGYNLHKFRVVNVELLDPVQCMTITEDVDAVIWCATDFDGNRPRAISGLTNAAFLFRAVAAPTKGRVEIEGLQNILGGLKLGKQNNKAKNLLTGGRNSLSLDRVDGPISFVLLSSAPDALETFETPFGEFNGLKRQGEQMLRNDFPSLTHCVLQMCRYEDNFVEESLDICLDTGEDEESFLSQSKKKSRRKINRRDAARAAVDALTNKSYSGKTLQVWTSIR